MLKRLPTYTHPCPVCAPPTIRRSEIQPTRIRLVGDRGRPWYAIKRYDPLDFHSKRTNRLDTVLQYFDPYGFNEDIAVQQSIRCMEDSKKQMRTDRDRVVAEGMFRSYETIGRHLWDAIKAQGVHAATCEVTSEVCSRDG